MVIVHSIDDNFISIEIPDINSLHTASSLLSKLKEDLYIDWEFILEELNETVEGGIENRRINIVIFKDTNKDKAVLICVDEYEVVALIPS